MAGVDLFFLISGFFMAVITGPGTSPSRFTFDRITRIVPLYWLATTVMLFGALFHLFPRIKLNTGYVVSSYLFVPLRAEDSNQILPLLAQGWTLNYEMFFYSIFLLVLLLPWNERIRLIALTALLTGLCLVGVLVRPTNDILATWTSPLVLEFIAGAWIGWLWKSYRPSHKWLGSASIATGVALFLISTPTEGPERVLSFGLPALLLLVGALLMEDFVSSNLTFRSLLVLGDASYSVYIWHGFIISIFVPLAAFIAIPPSLSMWLAICGATLGGVIAYRLIERPLLEAARRGVPRLSWKAARNW
ncbi:exopolysaccharide production protein ExoZ [Bradyrhizobium sp. LB9.1b]